MRGNIKNIFRKKWWNIILICLFGLLSITWFQGDRLIAIADFWFPSDGILYLSKMMHTWIDALSLGTGNFKGMATVFYGAYLALTNIIGLSTVASEKIFFYINFVGAGISMYYLTYVIGLRRPWRVVSALFYMMNPVAIDFFRMFSIYSFAPLLLGLYIKGLEQRQNLRYIMSFALIWLITTTYMYVDPSYGAILIVVFFSYLIFYIVTHRDIRLAIEGVRFTVILLLFFVLLNAFWMVPLGLNLSSELQRAVVPGLSNERLYCGLSGILLNGFRLLGYGKSLLGNYKGDLLFQWAPWYFQESTILIGLLIPVIAFLPLLSRDRKRKYSYYFGFLAIVGLFLITGANFPFGQFKFWLVKKIPYALPTFRNPLKFQLLIALSFAPLLGKGISIIYKFLLQKWHRLLPNLFVVAICFILFGYYSFPYWTGDIFRKGGEVIPSDRIEIPDYYSNAREWLNHSLENFRILPLPMSKTYQSAYIWESGFSGPNPDRFLLNKPTIAHNDGSQGYQVVLMIGKATEEPNLKINMSRLLGLLNIRYIMLHRDTNWEYIEGHRDFFNTDLKSLLSFIQQQSEIHLVKSFGKLDFYKISDERFLPRIYPITSSILVKGGIDEMFRVITSGDFSLGKSALFLSNDLDQEQIQFIKEYENTLLSVGGSAPKLIFQKINPTKYKVHVNASQPFFLVFSESYHPRWKAYIEDKSFKFNDIIAAYKNIKEAKYEIRFTPSDVFYLFAEPISDDDHFLVNGYANAWYIKRTGDYDITLYFRPQSLFYIGMIISVATFLGCLSYLTYTWRRKKKH